MNLRNLGMMLVVWAASIALSAKADAAPLLSVDFNTSTSPTETGFFSLVGNTGGAPYGVNATNVNLTGLNVAVTQFNTAGDNGPYPLDRGQINDPPAPYDDLYRDFLASTNNNGLGQRPLILTIGNVTPGALYDVTLYSYDSGIPGFQTVEYSPFNLTSGGTASLTYTDSETIVSSDQFSRTIRVSSTSNQLQIRVASIAGYEDVRLNAFSISAVPEPNAIGLLALGGMWLVRRRRG